MTEPEEIPSNCYNNCGEKAEYYCRICHQHFCEDCMYEDDICMRCALSISY